jgi:cyclohexyl-isocyanide hydratase
MRRIGGKPAIYVVSANSRTGLAGFRKMEAPMKIVALAFPNMTLQDLVGPIQTWAFSPGFAPQFVWKQPGAIPTDCGLSVNATHSFAQAHEAPDVLFVPGGGEAVMDLLEDEETLRFLADRGARAKWVTSVCTGSLILGAAGLLKGYRAGCHWGAREHLSKFGAIPDPARVVFDRNRASGGGVTSGLDFGLSMLAKMFGEPAGRLTELVLEYAPQPPFGTGRPDIADAQTLAAAEPMLSGVFPSARLEAAGRRFAARA